VSEKDKLRDIARRLLIKTKAREVNWQSEGGKDKACFVRLDKSMIKLTYVVPPAEEDMIVLQVSPIGTGVLPELSATLQAYTDTPESLAQSISREDDQDSFLLSELYREAAKVAYHWDDMLTDIDLALSKPGVMGLPQTQAH